MIQDGAVFDLTGKTAFVAGGTSGINLAIAERLVQSGAAVAVASRKPEKVEAAVARLRRIATDGRVTGHSLDVRDYDAVDATIDDIYQTLGPLDIVVSGAAGNFLAPAEAMSANAFRTVIEIDLIGTFNVFRAAFPRAAKPHAAFLAISAPQSTVPFWGQAHVCAAKAGIDMLVRALAFEWGDQGVTVNAIVPGPIDGTEGMDRLAGTPQMRRAIEATLPLRRFGTKAEIAAMAAFLASDAARYVTGAIIPCDGGQVLSGGGAMHPVHLTQ